MLDFSFCSNLGYYTHRTLVVYDSSSWVKFQIISTVITPISINMFNCQVLWWSTLILFFYLNSSNRFSPWLLNNCTLFTHCFYNFKFIIIDSMFNSSFYFINVLISLSLVSWNLILHIGVNQIIDLLLEIHLPLSDKSHIEHPLFIVQILHTNLDKLIFVNYLILIEIILLKLIFVLFPNLNIADLFLFEVAIVT